MDDGFGFLFPPNVNRHRIGSLQNFVQFRSFQERFGGKTDEKAKSLRQPRLAKSLADVAALQFPMGGVSEQFLRFGTVGVVNTLLDFALFNLLAGRWRWPKIRANLVSASVTMSFSFLANWHRVFPAHGGQPAERAVRFLIVTLTSGWLVQNGVIRLLDVWSLGLLTLRLAPSLPEARLAFLHRNCLKAAAVGAGMFWNYAWYRLWVFA
jgi:putative flippase GtrA